MGVDAPPATDDALAYVIWVVRERLGFRSANEHSVLGDDFDPDEGAMDQMIALLEDRYGPQVLSWPWHEIAPQRRTLATRWVAMPIIGWFVAFWLTGHSDRGQGVQRKEVSLGQIADALKAGAWIDL